MPLLSIRTNASIEDSAKQQILGRVSGRVAELLGKPEQYVMVVLEADVLMLFGGSSDPAACLNLKSLGLPVERTGDLSAALCDLMHHELNIDPSRVYIGFSSPDRSMWGWNGRTF